jgi:hypothetical protein
MLSKKCQNVVVNLGWIDPFCISQIARKGQVIAPSRRRTARAMHVQSLFCDSSIHDW